MAKREPELDLPQSDAPLWAKLMAWLALAAILVVIIIAGR
jgi:hypothetical protein